MSEFNVKGYFLDRQYLSVNYNSIIRKLSYTSRQIDNVIYRLGRYSGAGIESKISQLRRYNSEIKRSIENVRAEYSSMCRIIELINYGEKRAAQILGDVSSGYDMKEYTWLNQNYSSGSISETGRKIGELIKKYFGDMVNNITEDDVMSLLSKILDKQFSTGAAGFITGVIKYTKAFKDYFIDGKYSGDEALSSLLNLSKESFKVWNGLYGLIRYDNIKDFCGSTGKILSNVHEYIPLANVIFSTVITGVDDYKRLSADGDMSIIDYAELCIDSSIYGLSSVVSGLINLYFPGAGTVYSISTKESGVTEDIKYNVKKWAGDTGRGIGNEIVNNRILKELHDSGGLCSVISFCTATNIYAAKKTAQNVAEGIDYAKNSIREISDSALNLFKYVQNSLR